MDYVAPKYHLESFHCPDCGSFAHQLWHTTCSVRGQRYEPVPDLMLCFCVRCSNYSIWLDTQMIYPEKSSVPIPNIDLSEEIKSDYSEAALILSKSPRGAAALLRLAIQKLCKELGEEGKNINTDIASLVKKGLPKMIQQSLDTVRVVGNNAVHPGQMDVKDNEEIARSLFGLINLIADVMITQPKQVQTIYESLPQSIRDSIDERDELAVSAP